MKAVIYVGLAGTLFIGIYPQPAADWVVAATMMFADLSRSAALPDLSTAVAAGR
jgi:NADH-quinone oxidoreductase subunit N